MKNKLIIFLTVFLFSFLSQAQRYKTIIIDSVEYYVCPEYKEVNYNNICSNRKKECKLPDGNWVILYKKDTSKIFSKFELHHCQKENKTVEYYFNGNISKEESFKDGNQISLKKYYENGQIKSESRFHFVTMIGKRKFLFFRKKMKILMPIGVSKSWYENGQIKSIDEFSNPVIINGIEDIQKITSKRISYYKKGNKKKIIFTKAWELDSLYSSWYENGQVHEQFLVKDTNSITFIYYSDGSIKEKGRRKKTLKIGKWIGYYPNGVLEYEGNYEIISYYIDGVKINSPSPNNINIKVGEWIYYYPNGKIMAKGSYEENITGDIDFKRKEGWLFWNKKGKKISSLKIKNEYKIDAEKKAF